MGSTSFPFHTVHGVLEARRLKWFAIRFSEVKWSSSVLSDSLRPHGLSLPGYSVHGIFQARVLEWVAISFSRGSSRPRDQTRVSCIVGRHFTISATRITQKDLHDPDNHDAVITHLEPDILECKVKWALGSITVNKASGGDRIPIELSQILKDDAVKVLHSICQQIWKTQQWPQDWKRPVFILIPKKGNAKNVQTIAQLHLSHTLVK